MTPSSARCDSVSKLGLATGPYQHQLGKGLKGEISGKDLHGVRFKRRVILDIL
ncbi:hypothetical protein DPMN_003930 [Dreissena polymorpha]|uniref:Uncharacterized protein n=1 Tax=Dreissena polymorpha TaxID=45954 RepID=A0A9D4RV83_DREPO|nr:hypothetical protein DPMN_003930 [Dreissena polymorpha]